jgi:release factor glutamine methyltransferase
VTTVQDALREASQLLEDHDIPDARFEARFLLARVLHMPAARLYSSPERQMTTDKLAVLGRLLERRLAHEPAAYIVGEREFFGHDFKVTPAVLIPRPETELLVEKAIEFASSHACRTAADVGTGSGAIAVSLALALRDVMVYATDISLPALDVARQNCHKHGVLDRVRLLAGDLLQPLPEPVDIIAANLPYVADSELATLAPEIKQFEPHIALLGGPEGLSPYRKLLRTVTAKINPGGCLLLEISPGQTRAILHMAREFVPRADLAVFRDLGGLERAVRFAFPC